MTDLPKSHFVSDDLFNRAIRIHLIGCGGTGSQLAPRLVQLHKALLALGHPEGLQVSLWDSDTVSESNPLRQNYFDIDGSTSHSAWTGKPVPNISPEKSDQSMIEPTL